MTWMSLGEEGVGGVCVMEIPPELSSEFVTIWIGISWISLELFEVARTAYLKIKYDMSNLQKRSAKIFT